MRHLTALVFLTTFLISLWLASSSPIDPNRWMINRPDPKKTRRDLDDELVRYRRLASRYGVKEGSRSGPSIDELSKNLRKGEYICGNKVCKLKPGEIPKQCPKGLCQYPIDL
ncbi:hypothetical protein K1T71_012818 [Dendrolimus kikuchii]|uniref:Uncharacterized protein n=1 Tax=Dendrolimus kikuchii TaxID=765133 RepID=A0ACC1CIA8_9NEOP|nr:hypothetical protein K1T71_012818 [Dendrolimus kikuchii]